MKAILVAGVAVHFLAEFYHYHVLIHMQAVHILLMNTEKKKKKEVYRTHPGNEIASGARNSQKKKLTEKVSGHII